jgi:hypothetical protein
MSRRPCGAANAGSCANSRISRRQLIAGSAAVVIAPDFPVHADPAVGACMSWLHLEAQYVVLTKRWQDIESHLLRQGYWCDSSPEQLSSNAEVRELEAVDRLLDALDEKRQELLTDLPGISAGTLQGVALKLDVLASVIRPGENEDVRNIVMSILRDLKTMKQ